MAGGDIDWNAVILYGVPAWIAACGGAVAAILGAKNQRKITTSNGKTIAQAVEDTHAIVTDNAEKIETMTHTQTPETGTATA